MVIKVKDKEYELKFTFNSFKHLEDFNMQELSVVGDYPFKTIKIAEQLFTGALNHNPKVKFGPTEVEEIFEAYCEDESVIELLEKLMGLLEDSSFFKSLQRGTETK
jgi:hypothetical protein